MKNKASKRKKKQNLLPWRGRSGHVPDLHKEAVHATVCSFIPAMSYTSSHKVLHAKGTIPGRLKPTAVTCDHVTACLYLTSEPIAF